MLAVITGPNNIDVYFDPNDSGFNKKYSAYLKELQKLTPDHKEIANNSQKAETGEAKSRTNLP